jgi:hypothetical protein
MLLGAGSTGGDCEVSRRANTCERISATESRVASGRGNGVSGGPVIVGAIGAAIAVRWAVWAAARHAERIEAELCLGCRGECSCSLVHFLSSDVHGCHCRYGLSVDMSMIKRVSCSCMILPDNVARLLVSP